MNSYVIGTTKVAEKSGSICAIISFFSLKLCHRKTLVKLNNTNQSINEYPRIFKALDFFFLLHYFYTDKPTH